MISGAWHVVADCLRGGVKPFIDHIEQLRQTGRSNPFELLLALADFGNKIADPAQGSGAPCNLVAWVRSEVTHGLHTRRDEPS